jgi:diadenylate cyclase
VIVQKDRIAAAKVFLPLTLSKEVSRFFGTRHRAALGLTEESDALAVVISEERGEISLSRHGQIARGLTADDLRLRLQTLILQKRPDRDEAAEPVELDA